MNFTFDNQALRRGSWEGDALYLAGKENPVLGKLYLRPTSFTFRRPTDRQGLPFLSGEVCAISVNDGGVILGSTKGTYSFELFPSSAKSLRQWVDQKTEALKVVESISDSFLGCYDAYPHPFAEKHKENDESKNQIFRHLGDCIPV